jgi:MORN repeat variant
MKSLATISVYFLLVGPLALAQEADLVYLDEAMKPCAKSAAKYTRKPLATEASIPMGATYGLDGKLIAEGGFVNSDLTVPDGPFTFYHSNGQIESTGTYKNGLKVGVWQRFSASGQPMAEKVYDQNFLAELVHDQPQVPATYEGGEGALAQSVRYWLDERGQAAAKGAIDVSVTTEADGRISAVEMRKGLSPFADQQIKNALLLTTMQPAQNGGRPVRARKELHLQL